MRSLAWSLIKSVGTIRTYLRLPPAAKAEHRKDRSGLPLHDPGIERAVEESLAWLCRAQDNSISQDGGLARHFSLVSGWDSSYPETTGYIVPTMITCARLRHDEGLRLRARRALDWLVSIQFPDGSFQGGVIGAQPIVPVAFNTGQILLGLASGVREFGEGYRGAMRRAADWLVEIQDPDGCWRRYPSPFAMLRERAYDTHVAWGLFEAARIEAHNAYADAALANVWWALHHQKDNGWFENCCLSDPSQPLTHTLGYALRGILEAYRFTNDPSLLCACQRTADGMLTALRPDGFLPGRLDTQWRGTVRWACLTGTEQIAYCWFLLYQYTGETRYREAAYAANRFVRRTLEVDGPPEARGGIKGSFPVNGGYGTYEFISWAGKFFIDSNLLEKDMREQKCHGGRILR